MYLGRNAPESHGKIQEISNFLNSVEFFETSSVVHHTFQAISVYDANETLQLMCAQSFEYYFGSTGGAYVLRLNVPVKVSNPRRTILFLSTIERKKIHFAWKKKSMGTTQLSVLEFSIFSYMLQF